MNNLHGHMGTNVRWNRVSHTSSADLRSNFTSTSTEPEQRFLGIPTSKNGFLLRVSPFYHPRIFEGFPMGFLGEREREMRGTISEYRQQKNINAFNKREITRL